MLTYSVKNSKIYGELSEEDSNEWFNFKSKKFIHNIDSLYYVCYVKSKNYNEDENVIKMVNYLEDKKNEAIDNIDIAIYDLIDTEMLTTGLGFGMYAYSIEKKDKYIMFIARKKANENTPEIIIQIRSQYLWLYGEHRAVEESFQDVSKFLNYFGVEVEKVQENRIDYAYHTNYIQDPLNFFKEENLNKMQVSRFTRWQKQGKFVGETEVECDYITFGRRKSNNTFIRIYNKCQEVVSQQYKQFFIKVWLLNGLINRFDYYVLEKCFMKGNYDYVDKARLKFYLEYGKDNKIKSDIRLMLNVNDNIKIRDLADKLVPKLTIVCNIEFQTKRKFYSTMDKSINLLETVTCKYKPLERVFKILDNKDLFHDFITNYVIRFIDFDSSTRKTRCATSNWWIRLQSCEMNNVITDENRKLIREYQKNLDVQALKKRLINSLSTFSVYVNNENDNNLTSDITDFMSFLNESDIEKSLEYKQKKSAMLKNRLKNLNSPGRENRFLIVDSETAEILN